MRGTSERQLAMLSTSSPEDLIPADHPIRGIRAVVDAVLGEPDDEFDVTYARSGRPSVPPKTLLKATVLIALYSIRSERTELANQARCAPHNTRRLMPTPYHRSSYRGTPSRLGRAVGPSARRLQDRSSYD
jgi:hypothetical protein